MSFLKEGFLKEKTSSPKDKILYSLINLLKSINNYPHLMIFLSHSHIDSALAEEIKYYFEQFKIDVYIDWQDSSLPEMPSKETAEKIKNKIGDSSLFMLLATNNALLSRWCSWEIGFADSVKGYDRIVIVPITNEIEEFRGNEYLQLYKRIEITLENDLFVLEPEFGKFGIDLNTNRISDSNESLNSFFKKMTSKE